MKYILEKWNGKYLIEHEIKDSLESVELKDKQNFHIKLLAKRREQWNEDTK